MSQPGEGGRVEEGSASEGPSVEEAFAAGFRAAAAILRVPAPEDIIQQEFSHWHEGTALRRPEAEPIQTEEVFIRDLAEGDRFCYDPPFPKTIFRVAEVIPETGALKGVVEYGDGQSYDGVTLGGSVRVAKIVDTPSGDHDAGTDSEGGGGDPL